MNKRGQVTIFVIVGLVLLISASIVLYLTSQEKSFESDARRGVASDVLPVYDFVLECSKQASKEALIILGQQGGFIDIPPKVARTKSSYLRQDSKGIIKIPFWYKDGEDRAPNNLFIKNEIKRYLAKQVPICINNFESFKDSHIITEKSPITFDVLFTKKKLITTTNFDLDVTIAGQTKTLDTFVSELNVQLLGILDLANKIMLEENENELLESATIELMAINNKIPLNGLEMGCKNKGWHLNDVKTELQNTLKFNLPTVRFKNTKYPNFMESKSAYKRLDDFSFEDGMEGRSPKFIPSDSFEYLKLFWDVGAQVSNLEATVIYEPSFGMDLNGLPNDNGVLSVKKIEGPQKYLSFLCMDFYHFTYDVIYPVKIVIKDSSAFNGEGFVFQFAFPVLIDNNEGNRKTFGLKVFKGFEQNLAFCDDLSGPIVDIVAEGVSEFGSEALGDVNISLKCFSKTCNLGTTGPSFAGDFGTYKLTTPLPLGCSNPIITAEKQGYLSDSKQINSDALKLKLNKLVSMNVKVVKHPYLAKDDLWLPPEDLRTSENVAISFESVDGKFNQYVLFAGDGNNEDVSLDFVDDTHNYNVNILLTLFGDLIGGYSQENMTVEFDELDGRDTVVFHVFESRPTTRDADYLAETARFLYEGNFSELKPEFE